jgi:hypothetical protein
LTSNDGYSPTSSFQPLLSLTRLTDLTIDLPDEECTHGLSYNDNFTSTSSQVLASTVARLVGLKKLQLLVGTGVNLLLPSLTSLTDLSDLTLRRGYLLVEEPAGRFSCLSSLGKLESLAWHDLNGCDEQTARGLAACSQVTRLDLSLTKIEGSGAIESLLSMSRLETLLVGEMMPDRPVVLPVKPDVLFKGDFFR